MSPRVDPISLRNDPHPVAPDPTLQVSNGQASISYRSNTNATAKLLFEGVAFASIGPPNDEALPGHELYSAGLQLSSFQEVHDSPLIAELRDRNRKVFPNFDWGHGLRHFILTMKEETCELLATDFRESA